MKKNLKIAIIAIGVICCSFIFTSAKKPKLTKITMWYGGTVSEAGEPPADWIAYDIIREKLGIDLKLTMLPSNENDRDVKLNAAAASKSLPDVFTVNREPWLNMINNKMLASVDDMYEKMPHRTSVMYDKYAKSYTSVNGVSYGLASPGSIPRNEGLCIRKDWLDKLGLPVPVTLDDFVKTMKAFTFDDPDGNGKDDTYGFGAFVEIYPHQEGFGRRFEPIMGAFGVEGTWSMSKEHPGLNVLRPEYYEAVEFIKKLCDEKVIDPNWLVYRKDDFRASWKQGKFGCMREQNAALAAESNYEPFDKNFPNGEWIVIEPPVGPRGEKSTGCWIQGFRITAISAKAEKKKDAIARLFEWMSSDEGYYLLGWGQKGVNYVLDENGVPVTKGLPDPKKGFTKPANQKFTQLRAYVFFNGDIELYSRYPTYKAPYSGKTMSALDVLKKMDSLSYTPAVGSDAMPLPDADVKRFYEQGIIEFVTGKRAMTRDSWNDFIEQFKKIGGKSWNDAGVRYAKENQLLW
ncbi:extracellular solute-binding protein [Treponema pectinovorum]|uniref:extracellular solute-binding protein n=1 Tax=Treponema pectinovorum TaxID=164 RepID=UPI0011C99D4E|nr:extracellular solute-binding protein [Treponema pectinovorum]